MSDAASLSESLKSYLGELSLRSQCVLVREIERARLNGNEEPAHSFVLEAVRAVMREQLAGVERTGTPMRLFCEPLEPFLVDEVGTGKHPAWIRRSSLDAAWRYLADHPSFPEAKDLSAGIADALLAGDYERAHEMSARMRARGATIFTEALAQVEDARQRMQLTAQLGGQAALEDLADIAAVMRLECSLDTFAARLPRTISELSPQLVSQILAHLKFAPGDFIYPLMLVYRRLARPAQVVRLLVSHAGIDNGPRLAKSPLARCVDIVFADLDHLLDEISGLLGRPGEFDRLVHAVQRFYGLSSGLAAAIEIESVGEWHRRLAEKRRRTSQMLSSEVTRGPATIRRALKPRRRHPEEIVAPDPAELADATHAARLMAALRPYRSELAVNEVLSGSIRQAESFVEAVSAGILKDLRQATSAERPAAQAMFDAAVAINGIVFGEDYAAILRRSGQVAAKGDTLGEATEEEAEANESAA